MKAKIKMTSTIAIVFLCLLFFSGFAEQADQYTLSNTTKIELSEAEAQGLVRVKASGSGLDWLKVELESLSNLPLEIEIVPGTIFEAQSARIQNMVIRERKVVYLEPKEIKILKLMAACINMWRHVPVGHDSLTIEKTLTPEEPLSTSELHLMELLYHPDFLEESFRVQQFAIWTITENPPDRTEYVRIGYIGNMTYPDTTEMCRILALFEDVGIPIKEYHALHNLTCEVCRGYDLWERECVHGICEDNRLIEANSEQCGYIPSPPETSPPEISPPVETSPVETSPVETSPVETSQPETSPPETSQPETSPPETSQPETSPPDGNDYIYFVTLLVVVIPPVVVLVALARKRKNVETGCRSVDIEASPQGRYKQLKKIIEEILKHTDDCPELTDEEKTNRCNWILWHFLYIIWWESTSATKRVQDGGGPARGLIQMEPRTLWDLIKKYIMGAKKDLVENLAEQVGVTEKEMLETLRLFRDADYPKKCNIWWDSDKEKRKAIKQVEKWLRDCDSFAIKLMRYQYKRLPKQEHQFPSNIKNPQDEEHKEKHAEEWRKWWWRGSEGADKKKKGFKKRAKDLDDIAEKAGKLTVEQIACRDEYVELIKLINKCIQEKQNLLEKEEPKKKEIQDDIKNLQDDIKNLQDDIKKLEAWGKAAQILEDGAQAGKKTRNKNKTEKKKEK